MIGNLVPLLPVIKSDFGVYSFIMPVVNTSYHSKWKTHL